MHTLEVTDEELQLLHSSINSWINTFGHDEPEILRAGKSLRAKIDHELDADAVGAWGSAPQTRLGL
jgi:hypothetical protein